MQQCPFETMFEGASVISESFGYFEAYTYMGPDAGPRIQLATEIATGELVSLQRWIQP